MNHEEAHIQAHERAIENQTAESYFLGDLSEAERDAFEEHYFDCVVCAETVRAGAAMFDRGHALAGKEIQEEPAAGNVTPFPQNNRPRIAAWLPLAAAAALVVFIAIPRDSPPTMEIVSPQTLVIDARGGANDNVYRLGKTEDLLLTVDVHPVRGTDYRTYEIGVRTTKGKTIDTKTISAETANNTQWMLLPKLPAGSYEVVIEGVREDGNRAPVTISGFTVQR